MYFEQDFSSILLGRWVGNYPQEDLAKFGYKYDNNVEFFIKPHYILATCKDLWSKHENFYFCPL
jgi:hypothetical protein